MSSQDNNGKLIATAAGAAVAGAALAVLAMKMTENSRGGGGDGSGGGPNSYPRRTPHKTVLMNEPEQPTLHRESSESSLVFPHNHEEKMRRRIATRYTIEEDNSTPRNSVTVRVPATSANFGPGCKLMFPIFCFLVGSKVGLCTKIFVYAFANSLLPSFCFCFRRSPKKCCI